jgi:4-amino-4-deoxy-L-arabinose transferase
MRGTFTRWANNLCGRRLSAVLLVILFFICLYVLPLGVRPLFSPDESRYAEIPREMLTSGNWVAPHLNGLRYFEKPPLGYWLTRVSFAVFGENAFAARLPSSLATGLTALLIFLFSLRLGFTQKIALAAAVIYLTSLEIFVVGTTVILDNYLTLFLTAGIMAFYLARQATVFRQRSLYAISAGISLGLAFLTKGFLAFAVPGIVLLPWVIWQRTWRGFLVDSGIVLLVIALISLPWAMLIHIQAEDFWNYFFWVEHVKRFLSDNAQHREPFYYFLLLLPVLAFPWISFAPVALSGLRNPASAQDKSASRFLLLWFSIPFLFFSASSGKLATYIIPCFPPLAMLLAVGLVRYLDRGKRTLFHAVALLNALVLGVLILYLAYSGLWHTDAYPYAADEARSAILLPTSLLLGLLGAVTVLLNKNTNLKLFASGLMILPSLAVAHLAIPKSFFEHYAPQYLLSHYHDSQPSETIVISTATVVHAVAWQLKRDDIYLIDRGELDYGLSYADSSYRHLDAQGLSILLAANNGQRAVLFFCTKDCNQQYIDILPSSAGRHNYGEYSMWCVQGMKGNIACH